jgi:RNA polymerase sigma-70 factor (ECF subfamily)
VQFGEETLIKQCKHNDREAYNALFKQYEGYIYTICFYYTHSKEDALDLVQEVFIKIYRGMAKFEVGKPILPWIKRITVNTCLNELRKNNLVIVSLEEPLNMIDQKLEDTVAATVDVEGTVITGQVQEILAKDIAALSPEIKLAIILRHFNNMSYAEIGEAMSLPIGTVKTYLYRGRSILKAKLKQYGIGEA